ncbi:YndM family protein [Ornithinibacillus californiensis]|uniref:YndM family protein n=1 Tax=Ornithinibacillus californiensis TaxID=161536 RepID=UPI00069F8533|nr:YndM family protein [Ornithinibacillus californiensis]
MNLKALGIKLIVHMITVLSIFGIFFDASLTNLVIIGILATGISYLIGDRFLLRRFGNVKASIADFFLTFFTLAILGYLFIETDMPLIMTSLFAAFFITLTEPFIHAYILENEAKSKRKRLLRRSGRLQTEFAEETHTDSETISRKKDPRRDSRQ